ncbi:MAG: GGDEF domain-containing protein [Rhodospirillaceae bacterium]|nr:GGDEF domain-containing protein [Rhodospirillaceae bacterium]
MPWPDSEPNVRMSGRKLPAFWRKRSLRFWLATGMGMAVLPLLLSAAVGYYLHHRHITYPLVEVSTHQRAVLQPLQSIQLALWDVTAEVIDHASHADRYGDTAYEVTAAEIESKLAGVAGLLDDPEAVQRLGEANREWSELAPIVRDYLTQRIPGTASMADEELEAIDTHIDRVARLIEEELERLETENEQAHDEALAALDTAETVFFAAIFVSLAFVGLGVIVINRSLVTSMEELADAAMRLAAGDRRHRVEVQVPVELANVAAAFNDMTSMIIEKEGALEKVARTDALTGLYNRREFDRLLEEEINRAGRYGQETALVLIDIDHFKQFNDRFGHQGGDDALRTVARSIQAVVRDFDKACRFGGEELAVILPSSGSEAGARIAERVRKAIAGQPIQVGTETATVTISLGVAAFPLSGTTSSALLLAADEALYRSKNDGRNRVTVATPAA